MIMILPIFPVLIRAVYTDIKKGIIENRLLISALIIGAVLRVWLNGLMGFVFGLKMSVAMVAILFPLFLIKGIGAGDIKLLGVIALYMPDRIFYITAAAFILAGIWSVGRMIIRKVSGKKLWIRNETLHFSIPIAAGTLLAGGFIR